MESKLASENTLKALCQFKDYGLLQDFYILHIEIDLMAIKMAQIQGIINQTHRKQDLELIKNMYHSNSAQI
ncbi:1492_t:CDS:2 [Entrophospora sp. SA101]|nr:1492_t:CDS:2 [Entrophospora sp. SA101]